MTKQKRVATIAAAACGIISDLAGKRRDVLEDMLHDTPAPDFVFVEEGLTSALEDAGLRDRESYLEACRIVFDWFTREFGVAPPLWFTREGVPRCPQCESELCIDPACVIEEPVITRHMQIERRRRVAPAALCCGCEFAIEITR